MIDRRAMSRSLCGSPGRFRGRPVVRRLRLTETVRKGATPLTKALPPVIVRPMESLLTVPGYPALFVLSFLAATLLPLGSEWLLALMLLEGFDPTAAVVVAAVGNLLGACTTWAVGLYGGPFLIRRVLRIDAVSQARAENLYRRYGLWSLLFSWLPFVGDPLCLAAGILRIDLGRFAALVFAGKLGRYAAVAWLTLTGGRLFGG